MIVRGPVTTAESLPVTSDEGLCPVAMRCGGCPRIVDPSELQRSDKALRVQRLASDAGVALPGAPHWITGPVVGYRNRIRLALVAGVPHFFNAEKAHDCVVLEPALQVAMHDFRHWASAHRVALQAFRVAEVRTPDADGKAAVYLRHTERNGAATPAPDRSGLPSTFASGIVAFEGGTVEYQRYYSTADVWLWNPVGGFGQINTLVNQSMVQTVVDWLLARRTRTFLDLFAGSGNFSVPLRANGVLGVAVEWDTMGCDAHHRSLQSHGFGGVEVVCGDALTYAERASRDERRFDVVVLDPPRRGLRGNVAAVSKLARQAIVLVSCNAEQFAIDAAALSAHGFEIADYRLVDMFPHTDHIEIVALFERCALS